MNLKPDRQKGAALPPDRALWAITDADSRSRPTLEAVIRVWLPDRSVRVIPIERDTLFLNASVYSVAGRYDDFILDGITRLLFDHFVRPLLGEAEADQALKVAQTPITTHHDCGVRDHPFTPEVREAYELQTTYSFSCTTPFGVRSPLRYGRFICTQTRVRAQLRGTRLLLDGGGLGSLNYGRGRFEGLSFFFKKELVKLGYELAARVHNAGEAARGAWGHAPDQQTRTQHRRSC